MKKVIYQVIHNAAFIAGIYCWLALHIEAARNPVVFTMWAFGFLGFIATLAIITVKQRMPRSNPIMRGYAIVRDISMGLIVIAQGMPILGAWWLLSQLVMWVAANENAKLTMTGTILTPAENHIMELMQRAMKSGRKEDLEAIFAGTTPKSAESIMSNFNQAEREILVALLGREPKGGAL